MTETRTCERCGTPYVGPPRMKGGFGPHGQWGPSPASPRSPPGFRAARRRFGEGRGRRRTDIPHQTSEGERNPSQGIAF